MQARAVSPHSDDVLVPGGERISKRIRKPGAEAAAPLLRVVDGEHRKATRLHGAAGVAVERISHFPARGLVTRHKPLRPPLVLRTVAEEQDSGM